METAFIEAINGDDQNWGKFMVARFTPEEWERRSEVAKLATPLGVNGVQLLNNIGWARHHIIVFDLQTCEGALFQPGGLAEADLNKHRIWVCPLFQPFLEWLYVQDLSDFQKLPKLVNLPDAEFHFYGHRRAGPGGY